MRRKSRLQYFAVALGWVYTGLLFGLVMGAVFSPGHSLLIHFNRFGELWADVGFFTFAFGLMTWFLFFKLPQRRRTDRRDREVSPVLRRNQSSLFSRSSAVHRQKYLRTQIGLWWSAVAATQHL